MKNAKPMVLISTPFVAYHEIVVKETDLLEDAWGNINPSRKMS